KKAGLPGPDMFIRGALSGVFLGYATSLVFIALSQGLPGLVGAIIFPVGFVILVLLGLELATGNFALLPAALIDQRISAKAILRTAMSIQSSTCSSFLPAYFLELPFPWVTGGGGIKYL